MKDNTISKTTLIAPAEKGKDNFENDNKSF